MSHSTGDPAACTWQIQGMRVAYDLFGFYFKQGPLQAAITGCSAASAGFICLGAFLSQRSLCKDRSLALQSQQCLEVLLTSGLNAG